MFRYADLGRVWGEVPLPYQDEEGNDISIWLLFKVFTDEELDEREQSAMIQTARRLQREVIERMEPAEGEDKGRQLVTTDDMQAMFDAATRVRDSDREEVLARVVGWRGVADEDGETAEFSPEKLAAMLAHRPIFRAARDALYRVSREGVAKNSRPGAAGSRVALQA